MSNHFPLRVPDEYNSTSKVHGNALQKKVWIEFRSQLPQNKLFIPFFTSFFRWPCTFQYALIFVVCFQFDATTKRSLKTLSQHRQMLQISLYDFLDSNNSTTTTDSYHSAPDAYPIILKSQSTTLHDGHYYSQLYKI